MGENLIVPGATVRIVRRVIVDGEPVNRALYGHVLTVAPSEPQHLGTSGEPTISVAFLDPHSVNLNQLGKVDWHQAFTREVGVRHASHADVQAGMVATYYLDALPNEVAEDEPAEPTYAPHIVYNNGPFHVTRTDVDSYEVVHSESNIKFSRGGDEDIHTYKFDNFESAKAFVDQLVKDTEPPVRDLSPLTPDAKHTFSESFKHKDEAVDAIEVQHVNIVAKPAVPVAVPLVEETAKSSGDGLDACDWTENGNGTDYPTEATTQPPAEVAETK